MHVDPTIDQVFLSARVVTDGEVRPAAVLVKDGVIVDVVAPSERPLDAPVTEVLDAVLMPGLVDTHVHVNEPGRTAWEGFATATEAAARGGITTLVDMPLNSIPPTTTLAGLRDKRAAMGGQLAVDVGLWGGVVPGNARELPKLIEAGVFGFKCFLVDSGVAEFPHVGRSDLEQVLGTLRDGGVPLLTHAELDGPIARAAQQLVGVDPRSYRHHLLSRPKSAENEAIELMRQLSEQSGARVHIVHHSSSEALGVLERARSDGTPLTAETCPHYLSFAAEDIDDGATQFKCTPPIRERANQDQLWQALRAGVLDAVVSDHSPCNVERKHLGGPFADAWGGIASLQLTLPAVWTGAARHGASLVDVARWMCERPAALIAGMRTKGRIAKGYSADLVAFDPDARFVVDQAGLAHKNKITPYHGKELRGVVRATWLRGQLVVRRGSSTTLRNGRTLERGLV